MTSHARTPAHGTEVQQHRDWDGPRGLERIQAHLLPILQGLNPRADVVLLQSITERYVATLDDTGVNLLVTAIHNRSEQDLDLIARELLVEVEDTAYQRDRAAWIDPLYAKFHECTSGTGFGGPLARRALELLSRPFDDLASALAQARELAAKAAAQDPRYAPFAAAIAALQPPDGA